jgi:pyruvate/2-oxoglutarate dehydrogenase complex dihydrolipoamide acyltransferase (E2) component
MPKNILMPESMAGGNLARWLKRVGERVGVADVVAEVETDKATMQIEAPSEGVLVEIQVPAGSAGVAADTVLAVLAE